MSWSRRVLQVPIEEGALQSSDLSPDVPEPSSGSVGRVNCSSSDAVIKTNSGGKLQQQQHSSPFDSSMALTILVLLTALFFMGFFSIYIRRFSEENSSDLRRRRRPSRPGTAAGVARNKGGGVDSSTIKALPLVSYRGGAKQLITDCSICLSEFEEKEIVKLIPHCRHVFHAPCLDTWLSSHVSCPLCRGTQFFKMAAEEELRLEVDVAPADNGGGSGERSTADDGGAWRSGGGMRRSGSYRSLGDGRVLLRRSMSF